MQVMQSNKWTFSLTSLVVILALAFVAPSAMAGEFGVSITPVTAAAVSDTPVARHDISHADGHQLELAADLVVSVKFDRGVTLPTDAAEIAKRFLISTYDADGKWLANPTVTPEAFTFAGVLAGTQYRVSISTPTGTARVTIKVVKGLASTDAFNDDTSKEASATYHLLAEDPGGGPDVLKLVRVGEAFETVTSATFDIHVLLSEEPKGGFNKDLVDVGDKATVNSVVKLATPASTTTIGDAGLVSRPDTPLTDTALVSTLASWRDGNVHLYLVTIGAKPGDQTVSVKIKNFASMENPAPGTAQNMYIRAADSSLVANRDMLTVKTKQAGTPATARAAGLVVNIPKEKRILDYLIIAKNIGGSGIQKPDDSDKDAPKIDKRTPAQLMYNIIEVGIPNLETFLANGGTIDLVGPNDLVISEIMWGSDASLDPDNNSQWIEIKNNTGSSILTGDKTHKLIFYGPNETLPAVSTVKDRVGTVGAGGYWSIQGKGQSGRSGEGETAAQVVAVVPTQALISMQRVIDATGAAADGTMASSWAMSTPPALNFDVAKVGVRVASPGAEAVAYPTAPAPPPAPEPAPPATPAATASDIAITEIMVDTGGGRLPQWIELTNTSSAAVSLADWSVVIDNATDADVYGGALLPSASVMSNLVSAKVSVMGMGTDNLSCLSHGLPVTPVTSMQSRCESCDAVGTDGSLSAPQLQWLQNHLGAEANVSCISLWRRCW